MIYKTLLLLFISLPSYANFECNKTVDSSRVVFFIDANDSPKEIETAKKAACDRGESFLRLPTQENVNKAKELKKQLDTTNFQRYEHNCDNGNTSSKCVEIEQKITNLKNNLEQVGAYKKNIKDKINQLASEGKTVSSLIASGHDGGGHFYGDTGDLTKEDLKDIFNEHPDMRDQVGSILLLGCWTGVPGEIEKWKQFFPKTKLIGGYEGSAPAGDKPAGHSYLREMLLKEKTILDAANEEELKTILRGITHINYIYASVYADINTCDVSLEENAKDYLYQPLLQDRYSRWGDFEPTGSGNSQRCQNARDRVYGMVEEYHEFFSGNVPVPQSTGADSRLTTIYSFARNYQECFADEEFSGQTFPNAEEVFMMRFFHQMKMNFSDYFQNDINEIDELVEEVTSNNGAGLLDGLNQALSDHNKKLNKIKETKANLDTTIEEIREAQLAKANKELEQIKDESIEMIEKVSDPDHKKIIQDIISGKAQPFDHRDLMSTLEYRLVNNLYELSNKLSQVEYINSKDKHQFEYELDKQIMSENAIVDNIQKSINDFPSKLTNLKQKFKSLKGENIEKMSRSEIMEQAHLLEELAIITRYDPKGEKVKKLQNNANSILYNLTCVPYNWYAHPRPSGVILDAPTCDTDNSSQGFMGGGMGGFNSSRNAGFGF